ncbi:MAG: NADH-quinone oxidoreductase subunit NuoK [Planctomycetota bacterium]|jgi:NADH-quinone oxidoreductase subunit K|nr:NADH-quinone oxidoreductase subunit NuoK [Gemmataceae bacterium]NBS89503.1 NADH-quinone oxidoreductase subunit NuoK [bacterium]PHX62934.1 MAG: NADH-quinone oxidoreductase subunit NuoK [Planctomycetaceae bacterium]RLS60906.1 MAG: NADH-quinone oxidoreductase subunit NuoK [Planctomycetota bacterium]MBJ7431183.1 NADH-quinone oxidoreductase subunit NuoK [Gemmataceae bacterium]
MLDLKIYLILGAILFCIGLIGFVSRRNMITMFLSAELMLQGVAINFLAFSRFRGNLQGQSFVLFILSVAACEAAIALALIVILYRAKNSLDVSKWQDLREEDLEPNEDPEILLLDTFQIEPMPTLPVAGHRPAKEEDASHV